MLWDKLTEGRVSYPESTEKALEHEKEVVMPDYAIVDLSGRWPEVKEFGWREEVVDELDMVPF
jgi:hypothetical protein